MGAWIETAESVQRRSRGAVAPLVGAWIETHDIVYPCRVNGVAPLVGAWIETQIKAHYGFDFPSHPSWVRGLKLPKKISSST